MKNLSKIIAVAMFLFVGSFAILAGADVSVGSAVGSSAVGNNVSATRKLYLNNCARCHGADGKSMTNLGQELDTPDITTPGVKGMSTAKMSRIISKGDGAMPAFGKKLKPAQIVSIVRYVKSL